MLKPIKQISSLLGLDGAVFYTTLSRIVQMAGGLITILLVSYYFSSEEQGFFYTFSSVLATQVFFELGLGGVISQFVAHEMAFLKHDYVNNVITGSSRNLSRLGSLIRFCALWYALLSLLFIFGLAIIGFVFFSCFSKSGTDVSWRLPWLMVCFAGGLNLFTSPWRAVLQGLGKVEEMAKITFYQQLFVLAATWVTISFGGKLFVLAVNLTVSSVFLSFCFFSTSYAKWLLDLARNDGVEVVSYLKEVFPYQWRVALSWLSGYFIFQFFNPVIFATEGSVVAGQMGMTLAILNAITAISVSWVSTKIPLWSSLIALKDYCSLNCSFKRNLWQSSLIATFLVIAFSAFMFCFDFYDIRLSDRFLPWKISSLLLSTAIFNNIINAWATYLRCHKKEPFLWLSVFIGVLCVFSIVIFEKLFGVQGIVISYFAIVLFVSLPLARYLYVTNKERWHKNES